MKVINQKGFTLVELLVAAALGIGETLYQQFTQTQTITLDCENQTLYPL